jgi:hypothetical protein
MTKPSKSVIFFWGRKFAKFQPEKYESFPVQRIVHGKNSPNSPDFEKKKFPDPPGFKEQKVSQLPDFF